MFFKLSRLVLLCLLMMTNVIAYAEEPVSHETGGAGTRPYEQTPVIATQESAILTKADSLCNAGKIVEARTMMREYLSVHPATPALLKRLEALNTSILFSRTITDDSQWYTIQPGDTLGKIAKKFKTTVGLLKAVNNLHSSTIYAGEKIKVVVGEFKVFVDKSDNIMRVTLNGRHFKTYTVATGKGNSSPVGTFKITDRLTNPTWYHEGKAIPFGSPDNILGTRWLGFDLRSYGIHGTTLNDSIGTQSTSGCVRMFNKDVEEVFKLLPSGTEVVIVD